VVGGGGGLPTDTAASDAAVRRAVVAPNRFSKVYYNIITGLSVAVASNIGTVDLVSSLTDKTVLPAGRWPVSWTCGLVNALTW
jgi:high-affinity nickel permease